ncbi:PAAR-like protein [Streptomyces sp. NPDC056910]|uniref:PAAR-like protein n=1 Tax=Streptomyces sp. NPDC056910 TaxID=3345964 RepID=UPI00369D6614
MPGTLSHLGAKVSCPHGAPAQIATGQSQVLVSGSPVATVTDQTPVTGCPFQIPLGVGTKPQPCVRVMWSTPATRVLVAGRPALLNTSTGVCQSVEQIPQGPPLVTTTQTKVMAQ